MNIFGIIFMALSWGVILFLMIFCFSKINAKKDMPESNLPKE